MVSTMVRINPNAINSAHICSFLNNISCQSDCLPPLLAEDWCALLQHFTILLFKHQIASFDENGENSQARYLSCLASELCPC